MRSTPRLLALVLTGALLAAACGGDDDPADAASPASASGDSVSGDLFVTGSSTVEPISVAVAEAMESSFPDVAVDVEGPGTGDGFEKFCAGEAEVTDASRPIKAEEAEACAESGVEFIELKVAFDGMSVLTSPSNDAVECLTFADLYALVGPEAEGVSNWSDAQALAAELGSPTELPDLDLEITAPGEESGTYDSFIELALLDLAEGRLESGDVTEDQVETTRPDYSSQSDDNAIISGIEGADGSFGWVGFAFAEEAGDRVKELEVDGGDGCVAPSTETIADGSYPLSRPLFIYVNAAAVDENPAVAAYVDFYLGEGIAEVEGAGYVSLPDDQLEETRQAWDSRTTGTREG